MSEKDVRERVRALVDNSTGDPLAPFALRPGRRYAFSSDGRAAVGYTVRFGTAVAAGDPVGQESSWPSAVGACIRAAREQNERLAVLGAGERSRPLWAAAGLSSLAIGRDVVLQVPRFTLEGRAFRNLRQAVQRTRNANVSVEAWLEKDVPEGVRRELRAMLEQAGRDGDRGFSMILGLPFDGSQPEALILVARDRDGIAVGAQRYLRAGRHDLSLDVPVRAV